MCARTQAALSSLEVKGFIFLLALTPGSQLVSSISELPLRLSPCGGQRGTSKIKDAVSVTSERNLNRNLFSRILELRIKHVATDESNVFRPQQDLAAIKRLVLRPAFWWELTETLSCEQAESQPL